MRRGNHLAKATWRIPAERMKMRRPHDVPLSQQALAILRDIWRLSAKATARLPSVRSALKPLSENAMNSALRRMGYTKDEMCAHGFRSSASTILNERGYDRDVIEAALAHQDRRRDAAAYNRARYWPQRVKLLQDWADLLDEFGDCRGMLVQAPKGPPPYGAPCGTMHILKLRRFRSTLQPLLVANPHGAPVSPKGDIDANHGEATAVPFLATVEGCRRMALRQDAHRPIDV